MKGRLRSTYLLAVAAILVALLAPTLLCAVPLSSMNGSEHDCCAHMKQQECNTSNMSACCTPVVSKLSIATAAAEKKAPRPSVNTVAFVAQPATVFLPIIPGHPEFQS